MCRTKCVVIGWILLALLVLGRTLSTAAPVSPAASLGPNPNAAKKVLTATDVRQRDYQAPTGAVVNALVPTVTTDAPPIQLMGHSGGGTRGVFVQGNYVYIAAGPTMSILDISDPTHPTRVGYVLLSEPSDVYVVGDYAYVADSDGLRVVDISDPTAPIEVGFCEMPGVVRIQDVVVAGDYAYVTGMGLHVIEISDPTAPTEVGFYETQYVYDLAVAGDYVYVNDSDFVRIINVSDPAAPVLTSSFSISSDINDITVAGNHLYIAWYYCPYIGPCSGGLNVVDVSTPAAPVEVGSYDLPLARAVTVAGNYAYVIADDGLWIVDVSDPTIPTTAGVYAAFWYANHVTVAGNYAFVSNEYPFNLSAGLHVIDVSNPALPTGVSFYDNAPILADSVAVVHSPATDLEVTSPQENVVEPLLWPAGSVESGMGPVYAYVSESGMYRVRVIDVSNPAAPTRVGDCVLSTSEKSPIWGLMATDIAVVGDYAYIAAGDFWVVDISDPAHPVLVGHLDLAAQAVAIAGNYAYIAGGRAGLQVVDVSNPAIPVEVGAFDKTGYDIQGVTIVPGASGPQSRLYAYVIGEYDDGLRIIDVSDPTAPVEVGFFDTPRQPRGVAISGDPSTGLGQAYAYVVEEEGLQVLDISTPTAPIEVTFFDMPGRYWDVFVTGDPSTGSGQAYAYVAGERGLRVLDISDPAAPVEVGFHDLYNYGARRVTVDDGYIYATGNGLWILRSNEPQYFSITGRVADVNGTPFPGVTISAGGGLMVTTSASGTYTFTYPITRTFTLTPSLPGYIFWPPTRTVSVPPDASGQDFTVLAAPVSTTLPLSGTLSLPASLTYTDTQGLVTRLDFSPGAVSRPTQITLRPTLASGGPGWAFAGHAFELTAYQAGSAQPTLHFQRPVTVTLHYSDADVARVSDEAQLALMHWAGLAWQDVAQTCDPPSTSVRNLEQNALSVPICHLSRFGLFGPTHQVYLPLAQRAQ